MYFITFLLPILNVLCLDHGNYDYISRGLIVANVKRRDTIPLQPSNRRWINENNLQYRRTKDIREDVVDRRFEITEAQLREAQRDTQTRNSHMNEIRGNQITSEQLRGGPIRNAMKLREDTMRNSDIRENQLTSNYNERNSKYIDEKDRLDKLQSEMKWLTIDTDEGIGIEMQVSSRSFKSLPKHLINSALKIV